MAENNMRYRGILRKGYATHSLPSIKPGISGNMFPTSFDAMMSREWTRSDRDN